MSEQSQRFGRIRDRRAARRAMAERFRMVAAGLRAGGSEGMAAAFDEMTAIVEQDSDDIDYLIALLRGATQQRADMLASQPGAPTLGTMAQVRDVFDAPPLELPAEKLKAIDARTREFAEDFAREISSLVLAETPRRPQAEPESATEYAMIKTPKKS